MDLKALMQRLETINKTEILTESEKKETTWTDKSGKKHPATQVKGDKYTGKEAEKSEPGRKSSDDGDKSKYKKYSVPDADIDESFTSAIARALVEEFGYELDEADPNDPNATAATAANTKSMQAARAAKDGTTNYTSGLDTKPAATPAAGKPATAPAASAAPAAGGVANPYQGADAAKFAAMSPADQAWLTKGGGVPDINDQFILARAPNKGAPVKAAAPAAAPAAAAEPTAADRDDAEMGAAMTANAAQADAIKSGAQDDVTGVDAAVAAQAAAPAAPAAATTEWPADKNAIIAFQKANGLTADGLIGPKTMQALQKSGATPPAGFKPAGPKAASPKAPDQIAAGPKTLGMMPTAAPAGAFRGQRSDAAPAAPAGAFRGQRSDAAPAKPASAPTVAYNAAKDSQAANAAPAAPAANTRLAGRKGATTGNVEESIVTQDDAILAMIRNIRVG